MTLSSIKLGTLTWRGAYNAAFFKNDHFFKIGRLLNSIRVYFAYLPIHIRLPCLCTRPCCNEQNMWALQQDAREQLIASRRCKHTPCNDVSHVSSFEPENCHLLRDLLRGRKYIALQPKWCQHAIVPVTVRQAVSAYTKRKRGAGNNCLGRGWRCLIWFAKRWCDCLAWYSLCHTLMQGVSGIGMSIHSSTHEPQFIASVFYSHGKREFAVVISTVVTFAAIF